jgi:hypothetical protein
VERPRTLRVDADAMLHGGNLTSDGELRADDIDAEAFGGRYAVAPAPRRKKCRRSTVHRCRMSTSLQNWTGDGGIFPLA